MEGEELASRRRTRRVDYVRLNSDAVYLQDVQKYGKMLEGKDIPQYEIKEVEGSLVRKEWFDEIGFQEPFLVHGYKSLRMTIPSTFTVPDLLEYLGEDFTVRVIDVANQTESMTWKLRQWVTFFTEPEVRDRVLNVISLEFSGTSFGPKVHPPQFIDQIGWVETLWPSDQRSCGHTIRVQRYLLMSMEGSYTDFHVDFGGSSVWYHLQQGKKIFYLIPPTDENLSIYEEWSLASKKGKEFLADLVSDCTQYTLEPGQTLVIPSGWIHAVYTTEDSVAFGGNFLHGYNIQLQLRCAKIEENTGVAHRFRFPSFSALWWYVAAFYTQCLRYENGVSSEKIGPSPIPVRALSLWEYEGLEAMLEQLEEWNGEAHSQQNALDDLLRKSKAASYMASQRVGCKTPHALLAELRKRTFQSISLKIDKKKIANHCETSQSSASAILKENDSSSEKLRVRIKRSEIESVKLDDSKALEKKKSLPRIKLRFGNLLAEEDVEDEWKFDCSCGVCAMNYDDGWPMVECGECKAWQHMQCEGVQQGDITDGYKCKRCERKSSGYNAFSIKIQKKRKLPDMKAGNRADEDWNPKLKNGEDISDDNLLSRTKSKKKTVLTGGHTAAKDWSIHSKGKAQSIRSRLMKKLEKKRK